MEIMFSLYVNMIHKYTVEQKLGGGRFGQVYQGHAHRSTTPLAIKIECRDDCNLGMLRHEASILHLLNQRGVANVPRVVWWGACSKNEGGETVLALVMQPVFALALSPGCDLDLTRMVAKMIGMLQAIHDAGIVHRDIKPKNFMWLHRHVSSSPELYILDFGLATSFATSLAAESDENELQEHIVGTPKFISLNVHRGHRPSRRDDLISVVYIAVSFLQQLPWDPVLPSDDPSAESWKLPEYHVQHPRNQERQRL